MFEPPIVPERDHSQVLDGLVGAIRNLASDQSYKIVTDVFNENLTLRDQNHRLTLSHQEIFEQYRQFRNTLEASETQLKTEKATLESEIQQKSGELSELGEAKSQLETELAETNAKLEAEKELLDEERRQKSGLETELDETKTTLEDEKKQKSELETELGETKTSLEEEKSAKASVETELGETKASLEEETKQKTALEGELSDTKASLEAEKTLLEEEKTKTQDLENQLAETKASLEDEKKRAEGLSEEITALQATLEEKNAEIDKLKEEVKTFEENLAKAHSNAEELEKTLSDLKLELQTKSTTLAELERYSIQLQDEPEDRYVAILDTIWTSIMDLAETTFSQDLEEKVLADSSCWSNLRGSEYLKHAVQIPLPQSNSQAAKQMRIAAVIAVLSRSLHRHVFRPLYIFAEDADLTDVLRELEGANPAQEMHARSTLLAVLPEREKRNAIRRVQTVVRETSWLVQHLLSSLQYEAFCTALERACKLACTQWRRIQEAQMKIEPYFGPPYEDYDWQVLPLPDLDEGGDGAPIRDPAAATGPADSAETMVEGGAAAAAAVAARMEMSGARDGAADDTDTTAAGVDADDEATSETGTTTVESEGGSVEPDAILLVVWPSMCAVEDGELQSITQGLVVSKEQARAAAEEVRAERGPRSSAKRARSMSMRRQSTVGADHRPFLLQKEGGGEGDGPDTSNDG
ncbi:Structural maintenance of chromosomes protein 6 [Pleurostoma richardsiae]|uniref:Structural maintenance of chromosomes protein 6 n=1 Tax=Pleurostoma richardsiae TaxID=41990 RepID=A0AA38RTA6_9PEZI|nr:Structural maintenance of chromosomes protein 6 [Pleurostoma richardsiae]